MEVGAHWCVSSELQALVYDILLEEGAGKLCWECGCVAVSVYVCQIVVWVGVRV